MNEVRILKYPFKKTKSTTITILSFEITNCIVIPFLSSIGIIVLLLLRS